MPHDAIWLLPEQVPSAIRGAYTGRKIRAIVTESVSIPCHAGLWSGGSCDDYHAVRLSDGASLPMSDGNAAYHGQQQNQTISLSGDIVVIKSTVFQGKDLGITIYMHPGNAAPLLPAKAEFAPYEKLVLVLTATRKSSYNGQDRYDMGKSDMHYAGDAERAKYGLSPEQAYPTRAQWSAAKDSLIARGLLNKAGAITVPGRNAIAGTY